MSEKTHDSHSPHETAAFRIALYAAGRIPDPGYVTFRGEDRLRRYADHDDPRNTLDTVCEVLPGLRQADRRAVIDYFGGLPESLFDPLMSNKLDRALGRLATLIANAGGSLPGTSAFREEFGVSSAELYAKGIDELADRVIRRTGTSEPSGD